ncbi:Uncharacterised protein [Flavonifractor plautii]|uniref:Uncharacterized protein n=1 Tax=Flavonifractor plautii TaxID=292800 RepID=A0A174TRD0_FLAPL|nr:Uncharacterised protein [Flavonifractor plautii]
MRESWVVTASAVRGRVRAASGTGPSTVATRSSGSSTPTRAGSPGRSMA